MQLSSRRVVAGLLVFLCGLPAHAQKPLAETTRLDLPAPSGWLPANLQHSPTQNPWDALRHS
jgi:hypothetical protein